MRIESVRIQNFRAFKDQTVFLGPYTCLAGPNGSGKSTVLTALNVFFRYSLDVGGNLLQLEDEDFHRKDVAQPVMITVTFTDLPTDAQADFAGYYRQGKLVVTAKAEWNAAIRRAEVKQYGQRLGILDFAPFFKADGDGAKVDELKKHYSAIRAKYPSLPLPGTKPAMTDALRGYEDTHQSDCSLIPSEDQFYGVTKGKNLLEKYIQWILVPAVKDATVEQLEARKTALGLILERTVRAKVSFAQPLSQIREKAIAEYQKMLADRESELSSLSESLTSKFQDWAHPEAMIRLRWRTDADGAVKLSDPLAEVLTREGAFVGQLARFGHGLQRSFLITLLQELAGVNDATSPTLVLACEEPELFQHPPQIRHLASVFQKLTDTGAQVLVCTHSPLFVRGKGFEDIRLVRRDAKTSEATVKAVTFAEMSDAIAAAKGEKPIPPTHSAMKIAQALQPGLNEMFFTSVLILVEGVEDAAYINSYLTLSDRWDEFRRLGCHIVPVGGKPSMIQPLAIAKALCIPTFIVFDGDADKCAKAQAKAQNEAHNGTLMALAGFSGHEPIIPTASVWKDCVTLWHEELCKSLINDVGANKWEELNSAVQNELKLHEIRDLKKNAAFIGELMEKAWDNKVNFPSLEKLCNAILDFARTQRTRKKAMAVRLPAPGDQNEVKPSP